MQLTTHLVADILLDNFYEKPSEPSEAKHFRFNISGYNNSQGEHICAEYQLYRGEHVVGDR